MFSPRERDFLAILARDAAEDHLTQRRLVEIFPNPVYRRKLLWGIRNKAARAAADWDLYSRAARADSRILPGAALSQALPVFADPLVTVFGGVRRFLKPHRSRSAPGNDAPRMGGR